MTSGSPARKIGIKHYDGIRGKTPEGQAYESLLENDFLTLIRFDLTVASYFTQPCRIDYRDANKPRHYTPDVLIHYHNQPVVRQSELIEVKPSDILADKAEEFATRFAAATKYAESLNWVFRIVTEDDIPPAQLNNARFLMRYLKRKADEGFMCLLQEALEQYQESTVESLIRLCQQDEQNRARLLTELWTLIANRKIGCDMGLELKMSSRIWWPAREEI